MSQSGYQSGENHEYAPSAAIGTDMTDLKEFAASSNGDRWLLGRDAATQEVFVLHMGNQPSGGHQTRASVQDFLNMSSGPEREALIALLGVADDKDDGAQTNYASPL